MCRCRRAGELTKPRELHVPRPLCCNAPFRRCTPRNQGNQGEPPAAALYHPFVRPPFVRGFVVPLGRTYLLTQKSGNIFRVGIFLDFVRLATRTPRGAHVRRAKRNRVDPNWGGIERLWRRNTLPQTKRHTRVGQRCAHLTRAVQQSMGGRGRQCGFVWRSGVGGRAPRVQRNPRVGPRPRVVCLTESEKLQGNAHPGDVYASASCDGVLPVEGDLAKVLVVATLERQISMSQHLDKAQVGHLEAQLRRPRTGGVVLGFDRAPARVHTMLSRIQGGGAAGLRG